MSIRQPEIRPYSKAIFNMALEQGQLESWRDILGILAEAVIECEKNKLLNNPKITSSKKISFFTDIVQSMPEAIGNLVRLLTERKKLALLPEIVKDYHKLYFAHHKVLEVIMTSAYELDAMQKEQLLQALQKRYQREILLKCRLDQTLIGGAVLHIGDRVINGSIIGMLQRLKQNLLVAKN